jgi:hypothetical protein
MRAVNVLCAGKTAGITHNIEFIFRHGIFLATLSSNFDFCCCLPSLVAFLPNFQQSFVSAAIKVFLS